MWECHTGGEMFKRTLAYCVALIILVGNNFMPLLKSFIGYTLKYKVDCNLKFKCV